MSLQSVYEYLHLYGAGSAHSAPAGDTRPSLEARYATRAAYVDAVRAAAQQAAAGTRSITAAEPEDIANSTTQQRFKATRRWACRVR
jgi:hypothetical protein